MKIDEIIKEFGDINCCQVTLLGLLDEIDLSKDIALKIATGFGGGLGKADVCGVVSGACMGISMRYGMENFKDLENKELTKAKVKEFMNQFIEKNGSHTCKGLLGFDKTTEEGKKKVEETDIVHKKCPLFIKSGVDIAKK